MAIGYGTDDWNSLIQQINLLAAECGVDPLPEAEDCRRWEVQDIEDAHNKLLEICPDSVFSEIDPRWMQVTVDEIQDAINAGACCAGCKSYDTTEVIRDYPIAASGTFSSAFGLWPAHIQQVVDAVNALEAQGNVLADLELARQTAEASGDPTGVLEAQITAQIAAMQAASDAIDVLVGDGWTNIGTLNDGTGGQLDFSDLINPNIRDFNVPYFTELIDKYLRNDRTGTDGCSASWTWGANEFGLVSGFSVPGGRYVTTPGTSLPDYAPGTPPGQSDAISWQTETP